MFRQLQRARFSNSLLQFSRRRVNTATSSALPSILTEVPLSEKTLSLANGVLKGERVALSRAITLIESSNPEHEQQAELLLEYVLKNRKPNRKAFRVGITGPPGSGKSTFIEALGGLLLNDFDQRLAVIAVDPSSHRSHGSILGDKTRMTKLSVDERAFIRPSPSRCRLGGVAQHTNDVILLVESAGFDMVLVETVGLGQSEIEVDECVDMLVLLVPPALGDELQGSKKGIMEVADMVVVNKADGNLKDLARHAAVDYSHALQLARRKREGWVPPVKKCSSTTGEDIRQVWDEITRFRREMAQNIADKRKEQAASWMWTDFQDQLVRIARDSDLVLKESNRLLPALSGGFMSPRHAARDLLKAFLTNK